MSDDVSPDWPGHNRDRMLSLVAPLLLAIIAAIGVRNYHEHRQSSWQGASFGMFATYDNVATRGVRVTIEDQGESKRVDARSVFGELVTRSRVEPFGPAPVELAREVRDLTGADVVTVEVWAVQVVAAQELAITPQMIRRVTTP